MVIKLCVKQININKEEIYEVCYGDQQKIGRGAVL